MYKFSANHDVVRCDERRTVIEENKKLIWSEWMVGMVIIKCIEMPWNLHQGLFAAPTHPNTITKTKSCSFSYLCFRFLCIVWTIDWSRRNNRRKSTKYSQTHNTHFLLRIFLSALHWHMGGFWCALCTQIRFYSLHLPWT